MNRAAASSTRHWAEDLEMTSPSYWTAVSIIAERTAAKARQKEDGKAERKNMLASLTKEAPDEECEELQHEYLIQWLPPRSEFGAYPSLRSAQVWWTRQDLFVELADPECNDDTWFDFAEAHGEFLSVETIKGDTVYGDDNNSDSAAEIPPPVPRHDEFEEGIPLERALALVRQFLRKQLAPKPQQPFPQSASKEAETSRDAKTVPAADTAGSSSSALALAISEYERNQQPKVALEQMELVKVQGEDWLQKQRRYYSNETVPTLREAVSRLTKGKETGGGRRQKELAEYCVYLEARRAFRTARKEELRQASLVRAFKMCPLVAKQSLNSPHYKGIYIFDQELVVTCGAKEVNLYSLDFDPTTAYDNWAPKPFLHLEKSISQSWHCHFVQARRTEYGDFVFSVENKVASIVRAYNLETGATFVLAFIRPLPREGNPRQGYWAFNMTSQVNTFCAVDNGLVLGLESGALIELALDMEKLETGTGFDFNYDERNFTDNNNDDEASIGNWQVVVPEGSPGLVIDASTVENFTEGVVLLSSSNEGNAYAGATHQIPLFLREFAGTATRYCPLLGSKDAQGAQQTPVTQCISFSPDARHVVIGRNGNGVWLFEVDNFAEGPAMRYVIPKYAQRKVESLTITLDGRLVASIVSAVAVFSLESSELLYFLTKPTDIPDQYLRVDNVNVVTRVFFQSQDLLLTFSPGQVAELWSPEERMTKGARKR